MQQKHVFFSPDQFRFFTNVLATTSKIDTHRCGQKKKKKNISHLWGETFPEDEANTADPKENSDNEEEY